MNLNLNAVLEEMVFQKNKIEGDFKTPRGTFKFGTLYWREIELKKPFTKLYCKKIKKIMGWCNDSKSKFYNKEIKKIKKLDTKNYLDQIISITILF